MIEKIIAFTFDHPVQAFFLLLAEYIVIMLVQIKSRSKLVQVVVIIPFLIQDWVMNLVLSVLCVDLPGHVFETTTGRMKRYKREYSDLQLNWLETWRYKFAVTLCRVLNKYDEGHC